MSDTEELEPFEQKVVDAGHVLVREADGSVDIFVMDNDLHNGPGCSVCGDCWCHHCDGPVEPCDGGKAKREAEDAARIARAAPDMLAALIALEKLATGHAAPVGSMHAWWDDIFNARDAIKKATGA